MIEKFFNLIREIQIIGLRATLFRVKQQLLKFTGLDVRLRPIISIDADWFFPALPLVGASQDFLEWWRYQPNYMFFPKIDDAYIQGEPDDVIAVGRKAAQGKIQAFRGMELDFGWPIDWYANPVDGVEWPILHSLRTLTADNKSKYGDIKFTWEIGRFLHIPDIIRAWVLSKDDGLLKGLIEQVQSFEIHNPMYQGPHWTSEQEVSIRGAMLSFALLATKDSDVWTDETVLLFLRQIAATAEYCMEENNFARACIRNNHFVAGALAPYIAAAVMPWHPSSGQWRETSEKWLKEALATQWYDDGGYIQPSHNYHRLTLDYFMWVLRIAESYEDQDMVHAIKDKFKGAFSLLYSMMQGENGELPNWGPNDGACFAPWTACDYNDFRPLLSGLFYAINKERIFKSGLWDEQLFWLWGVSSIHAPVAVLEEENIPNSFSKAGLHKLTGETLSVVLRCGPVLSRYGQQADQLHVDVWRDKENIMIDPGSYSYNDRSMHDWFRSTLAHNTVSVEGKDQMSPYRQFLYLNWPSVKILELPQPVSPVRQWAGGLHHGYMRLPQRVCHARLVLMLEDDLGCLVVDRLTGRGGASITQNWTLKLLDFKHRHNQIVSDDFAVCWNSNLPITDDFKKVDRAWLSRYYGVKQAMARLELSCHLSKKEPAYIATWFGDSKQCPIELAVQGDAIKCGTEVIDLPQMFVEL